MLFEKPGFKKALSCACKVPYVNIYFQKSIKNGKLNPQAKPQKACFNSKVILFKFCLRGKLP